MGEWMGITRTEWVLSDNGSKPIVTKIADWGKGKGRKI